MNCHQIIQKLRNIQVVEHGSFTLKSGLTTDTYIDLRKAYSYPELMKIIGDALYQQISKYGVYLVGVPTGGVLFAAAISMMHDMPMLTIRDTAKTYGKKQIIEGDSLLYEKNAILIEDVISTGESVLKYAQLLESEGFEVVQILCIVDRNLGGVAMLNEKGYPTQALMNIDDFLLKSRNCYISKLKEIIKQKKSNIVVALDFSSPLEVLEMAQKIGPYVCGIKLHLDIIDFSEEEDELSSAEFINRICKIKKEHNFIVIDDRKYADIASISTRQFRISQRGREGEFVDLVTMHPIVGESLIDAFQKNFDVGILLVYSMSCANNLINDNNHYEYRVEHMSKHYSKVSGFISQKKVREEGLLTFTPGISILEKGEARTDGMGQQYRDPAEVETDVYIIGRGITGYADDPILETQRYMEYCWNCQHS